MSRGVRVADVERGEPIAFTVDGVEVSGHQGETLGAALLALGTVALRRSLGGSPRGMFCNMGVCSECVVTVDSVAGVRACVTELQPGMDVRLDA